VTQKPVLLLLHRVTEELSSKKPGQTKPTHSCKKWHGTEMDHAVKVASEHG